jgi:hypothetical protein
MTKLNLTEQQLAELKNQIKQEILDEMKSQKQTTKTAKGIGNYVYDLLENPDFQSKTYKELAEIVSLKFDSNTTAGCISWYISHKKDYNRNPLPRLSNKIK